MIGTLIASIVGSAVKEAVVSKITGKPVSKPKNTSMPSKKGLVQSKTIWGGVAMLLPTILGMFGVNVSEGDLLAVLESGSQLVGAILVVWGRMGKMKEIG